MESAVPFIVVTLMFGIVWLVAIGLYLGREQQPETAQASTLEAVAPGLEKTRFLADPIEETATAVSLADDSVIHEIERYLEAEQSCAARFVASPSIELLYSRSDLISAVA